MTARARAASRPPRPHHAWFILPVALGLIHCEARPKGFGAYSRDLSATLAEGKWVKRACIDCVARTSGGGIDMTCSAGLDIGNKSGDQIPTLIKPEVLLYVSDPTSVDKFKIWGGVRDTQKCGCGRCTDHLWSGDRAIPTKVEPRGDGLFVITVGESVGPGVYNPYNDSTEWGIYSSSSSARGRVVPARRGGHANGES
jgi:hypothetical protein